MWWQKSLPEKKDREQHECKQYQHLTILKSGTVMHKLKLPFRYRFIAMHLLSAAKKSFSAKEIQHQFRHKHYHSIWHNESYQRPQKRDHQGRSIQQLSQKAA